MSTFIIARRAALARDWRKLAKKYREYAKNPTERIPARDALSDAMRCEAMARENEAWIRNLANNIIAQAQANA
jgi:hypothetical protein